MHDYKIPIGPQSPSMKEPICIRAELDGNYIQGAKIRLGYVHRGAEKLLEGHSVIEALYLVEHICGICNYAHSACFTHAMEKMLNFEPELKVRLIRTMIAEFERIHSHLLWFGFAMHEIGYETFFNYAMREREHVLECFEKITGKRVHFSINKIKGVRYDLAQGDAEFVMKRMNKIESMLGLYLNTVNNNKVIRARLENVGNISKKTAREYCLVGPMARASNIAIDVRKDEPYAAYKDVDFELITEKGEDALARTRVRLRELEESIGIVKQIIDMMPQDKIPKATIPKIDVGEDYARVEAPRGEDIHYYKVKDSKIVRGKIRTPTLANIAILEKLLIGQEIGNVPVLVSTLDPCFGCMERMIVVKEDKEETLNENEFRNKYC